MKKQTETTQQSKMIMSMRQRRNRRGSQRGVSLIEAALGSLILIPIALLIVDLIAIVIANSMNDTAVKNCARAGANQPDGALANQAAEKARTRVGDAEMAVATFQTSGIVKSLTLAGLDYTPGETCTANTIMEVNLPVPLPGFSNMTFNGKATEPIVGMQHPD